MRILLSSDHAGYPLKESLKTYLSTNGFDVEDLGTFNPQVPSDYPDLAVALCDGLLAGRGERGILVCGSGVGVTVAANKYPGIRAAVCHDTYSAHQGVEHDAMNVLCLGARIIGDELAKEIVRSFCGAKFSEEPRHKRRLAKVDAIEKRFLRPFAEVAEKSATAPAVP